MNSFYFKSSNSNRTQTEYEHEFESIRELEQFKFGSRSPLINTQQKKKHK